MHKLFHTLTVLALMAALSACGPESIPQVANPAANLPTHPAPTARPVTRATAYPTPTTAPSITPISSPSAQPSLTSMPRPANSGIPKSATITPTAIVGDGSNGCDNANMIKDVTIPDGTQMSPGQTFLKTWRFYNSGTCPWPGSTTMKFIKGDTMQSSPGTTGSLVPVNNKVDVSVTLVAPQQSGSYKAYFRLSDKDGNAFGPIVTVSIVVIGGSASNTPAP